MKLFNGTKLDLAKNDYVINESGLGAESRLAQNVLVGQPGTGLYSARIPVDLNKGISLTDDINNISLGLTPDFTTSSVNKLSSGHFVYNLGNGSVQAVYTPQKTQLAEDIIVNHYVGNALDFPYTLNLPNGFKAFNMAGGSIGIEGANNIDFSLSAPVIKQSDGRANGQTVKSTPTKLILKKNKVYLMAVGLKHLSYPISIDPSVSVNSSNMFSSGNNEGGISRSPNQINNSTDSGGALGPNNTSSISCQSGFNKIGMVWCGSQTTMSSLAAGYYTCYDNLVYNNYAYEIVDSSGGSNVYYATLSTSGGIGAWTLTGSLSTAVYEADCVVVGNYMYIIGGYTTTYSSAVFYAPISSNGVVGTWNPTTSLTNPTNAATAVVANGYIYEIGGGAGTLTANVYYATINSTTGVISSWTPTTGLETGSGNQASSVSYNGYIYVLGGQTGAAMVEYAQTTASGGFTTISTCPTGWTLYSSTWCYSTSDLPDAQQYDYSLEYNGYIYEIGGYSIAYDAQTEVYYAALSSNGSVGTWIQTVSLPMSLSYTSAVEYSGYVYITPCFAGSVTNNTWVIYTKISSSGGLGYMPSSYESDSSYNWFYSSTGIPVAENNATSVVYDGYIYLLGGTTGSYLSEVDFAPLNSSGGFGSQSSCPSASWTLYNNTWCDDASGLPAVVNDASSVIYNGFVYVIGGLNVSSTATQIVEYAPLSSTGGFGSQSSCPSASWTLYNNTWCVNSSGLPIALYTQNSVVYNGYIYVIGGYTSSAAASSGVYYAPLGSNGAFGTQSSCPSGWTLYSNTWCNNTTSLTAVDSASSVVYNGFIYVLGGLNSSGVGVSTVQYAQILSNGSVGAWGVTTSLTTVNYYLTSIAYNGYVYEIGGSGQLSVNFAPINSDGTLGSWQSTTSLSTAGQSATSDVYNGFIYVLGGYNGSVVSDANYAQISGSGFFTPWTTTSALVSDTVGKGRSAVTYGPAVQNSTAVTYNGYIYNIGGSTNSVSPSAYSPGIEYASISSNGTLGTWTTTTSLPTGLAGSAAFAYNNYLYVFNGTTAEYVSISSTGALGTTWTTTTSPPISDNDEVEYNGYVYLTSTTSSYYISITSTGALGATWISAASIPIGVIGSNSVVYGNYIYDIGATSTTVNGATVEYASLNANGGFNSLTSTSCPSAAGWTLGTSSTWCYSSTNMPIALYYATAVASGGYIYEITGCTYDNTCNNSVLVDGNEYTYYAPINSNGSLGSWTESSAMNLVYDDAASVVWNNYIYEVGGVYLYDALETSSVEYVQTNNIGIGNTGAFATSANSLLSITSYGSSVTYSGYIYELGGYDYSTGAYSSSVSYSSIGSGGVPGAWNSTTGLYAPNDDSAAIVYNGIVYEFGGFNGSSANSTVQYAYLSQSGGLKTQTSATCSAAAGWTLDSSSTWCYDTTSLPTLTDLDTAVTYNGYVYVIGGNNGSANIQYVEYAKLSSSGGFKTQTCSQTGWSLDASGFWCYDSTSLPLALKDSSSVVYDGIIYEIGGYNGTASVSNVYYVPINSDGSVGSWIGTNSLSVATSAATSVAYNGFMYEIGGNTTSATAGVEYAQISASGQLGAWISSTNSLPTADAYASSVVNNGYVYEIGGYSGSASLGGVYYAPFDTVPQVGQYSVLVNIGYGNDVTPTSIIVNGNNTGNPGVGGNGGIGTGGIQVSYTSASTTCTTFSAEKYVNFVDDELTNPFAMTITNDGCGNTTAVGEYVFVRFTLDDTQTATFPDINGNHTTITGFNIFYHPASSMRLRGGATFSNGSLQSLDAPPTPVQ